MTDLVDGRRLFVSVRAYTKLGAWLAFLWGHSVDDDRPPIDSTIRIGWPVPLKQFLDWVADTKTVS